MIRTHFGQHDDCFGCKLRTIQYGPSAFQPHYNYATGRYVRNEREFKDALKRGAAENSERTGILHDYQPVYPGDVPQPTKDDAIFETRARVLRDGPSAIPPAPDNPPPVNYDRELPKEFHDNAR